MNWTLPTILRLIGSILASGALAARAEKINFISVSDLHYGITRNFNGDKAASGQKVNKTGQATPPAGKPLRATACVPEARLTEDGSPHHSPIGITGFAQG